MNQGSGASFQSVQVAGFSHGGHSYSSNTGNPTALPATALRKGPAFQPPAPSFFSLQLYVGCERLYSEHCQILTVNKSKMAEDI